MDSCVRSLTRALVGIVAVGFAASTAWAGVADPVPLINGTERAKALYLVPGVTADLDDLGTTITCTSLEKLKDQIVAVEVFNEDPGTVINDITLGDGVVGTVSPGETVNVEITSDTGGILAVNADLIIDVGTLLHGSARVVSTSKKLMCTASIMDTENNPPTSAWQINLIVKKQKGD